MIKVGEIFVLNSQRYKMINIKNIDGMEVCSYRNLLTNQVHVKYRSEIMRALKI